MSSASSSSKKKHKGTDLVVSKSNINVCIKRFEEDAAVFINPLEAKAGTNDTVNSEVVSKVYTNKNDLAKTV